MHYLLVTFLLLLHAPPSPLSRQDSHDGSLAAARRLPKVRRDRRRRQARKLLEISTTESTTARSTSPSSSNTCSEGGSGRIRVIYTGGTMGMTKVTNENGQSVLHPDPKFLPDQLEKILSLYPHHDIKPYDLISYKELIDSSEANPKNWNEMLDSVQEKYACYDAFVFFHGTDTLSYSASALSYGLKNLDKPVIFTASQIPLIEPHSDAPRNILTALQYASSENASEEVVIVFDGKIIRGNQSTKINPGVLSAFSTRNADVIGTYEMDLEMKEAEKCPIKNSLEVKFYKETVETAVIYIAPGIDLSVYVNNIKSFKDIILLTLGVGNIPMKNESVNNLLTAAKNNYVNVYHLSQCPKGKTCGSAVYAAGEGLLDMGVQSGLDMTVESLYVKIQFMNTMGLDYHQKKEMFNTPLAREITPCNRNAC